MSLIKCPECNKKISDTVTYCPKCGYSIANHLMESPSTLKKVRKKHIIFYLLAFILLMVVIISSIVFWQMQDSNVEEDLRYPLFNDCITTANDLLGKDISPILNGYVENNDYTITTDDNCTTYTFPFNSFELGTNPNLILFVDSSSAINKVQYSFRIKNGGHFYDHTHDIRFTQIGSELTDYYDADPVYTYLLGKKQVKISKDEFENFRYTKKTTFYVTWQSSKGTAIHSFTNLYEEKDEYGTLTFTST